MVVRSWFEAVVGGVTWWQKCAALKCCLNLSEQRMAVDIAVEQEPHNEEVMQV